LTLNIIGTVVVMHGHTGEILSVEERLLAVKAQQSISKD
jgi:hypothetical protein